MTQDQRVAVERLEDGAVWRVALGGAKGNVIDAPLAAALAEAVAEAERTPAVKAVVLEGQGRQFSFGASVEEHLPGEVAGMLRRFHGLLVQMLDSALPLLAVVRGQCLGGGLELVTVCHRVFAARDARLGQPEIALGVFAPFASAALADRVGRRHAEDLCLTGRTVTAEEAFAMGLVDEVCDGDPAEVALAWAREHLLPRSASSLRYAVRAVRHGLRARLAAELPALERLYLDGLMSTADAVEGLTAFLEKRKPAWRNA
jgi:cyclohexa-1,5-dienecarbonyl-CoA hydratase